MLVDQPEHLRAWLSQVLQPLCDADPNALAKYVIALVKKDRDETELRQSMRDQLDVFLQSQTEPFVNRLFAVLTSKEYIPGTTAKTTEAVEPDSGASSDIAESEASIPNSTTGAVSDELSSSSGHKSNSSAGGNKAGSKKEEDERDRNRGRRKANTRSPPHRDSSRTYPSNENRYQGNDNDHKFTRSWADRNQRRPIRARRRSRSRPRTNRRHRYNSRSRSPVYPYGDSGSKKDANNPQKPGRETKDAPPATGSSGVKSGSSSKHESGDNVQSTLSYEPYDPEIESLITSSRWKRFPILGEQKPRTQSNRCRDYDEKGLCMRGDLCPFDHGVNPVVLEESLKGDFHMQVEMQDGFPSRIVRVAPGQYGPGGDGVNHPWPPQGFGPRVFMDGRGPRGGPPMVQYPPPPGVPRLLVDIPVIGVPHPQNQDMMNLDMPLRGMPRGAHPGRGFYMGGRGRGRGGFDRGRLGMKAMKSNCSLQVKKIPIESNNIMDLNGHFCKFGKIINIQINFENDPEAALVTFSSPEEAFRAYKSAEAVLNNRFIRVHWHNKEKENEDGDGTGAGRMSIKDRLGEHAEFGPEKSLEEGNIFPPGEGFPNQNFPTQAVRKDPTTERLEKVEAIKKSQEMLAAQETLRKALEEKKKETLKLMNNLKIRKGDMLKEHLEHQKKLIRKLETDGDSMSQTEKDQLLELMASLQNTIENIKRDIDGTLPPEVSDQPGSGATSQRDVLDAELDLYNKQLEGGDSFDLKRKLAEMRSKVPAKRGRGGIFRNSHIGGFHAADSALSLRSVDRRTTTICVFGYDPPKFDEILTHFQKFGTITSSEPLEDQQSVKLTFSNRKEAELAKSNGKVFAGRALEITWVEKPKYPINSSNGSNQQPGDTEENRSSDAEGEAPGEPLDQLYDQGEEEEEQEGERSWRR